MTGVVNTTGARSGVIGTISSAPSVANVIQTTSTFYTAGNSDSITGSTHALTRVESGSNDYNWAGVINDVASGNWVSIHMDFHIYLYWGTNTDFGANFGIARNGATQIYGGDLQYAAFYLSHAVNHDWNTQMHQSIHYVDKSPAVGTNTYYLMYAQHQSTVLSIVSLATTYPPFVCTLQEIAQ